VWGGSRSSKDQSKSLREKRDIRKSAKKKKTTRRSPPKNQKKQTKTHPPSDSRKDLFHSSKGARGITRVSQDKYTLREECVQKTVKRKPSPRDRRPGFLRVRPRPSTPFEQSDNKTCSPKDYKNQLPGITPRAEAEMGSKPLRKEGGISGSFSPCQRKEEFSNLW